MENLRRELKKAGFIRGVHIAKPEGIFALRGELTTKITGPAVIAREHGLNLRSTQKGGRRIFRFTEPGRGARQGTKLRIQITQFPGRGSPSQVEVTQSTSTLNKQQMLKIIELLKSIAKG